MEPLSDKASRLVRATLAQLRVPPEIPLAEWIESNVRLPEGLSAMPGRMKLWPYQAAIANAIGDPHVERVVLVKAARIGFTSLLTAALANWTSNDPQAVLVLLPVESDCRDYVTSDLEPLFAASGLAGVLTEERVGQRGKTRNTILSRKFPGGSLKIVAAQAPRNLRRHTAKILLIDEADAMEASAEGNPLALAEKRTLTFADRKIIVGSTPLLEDTSHVLRAYAASDMRVFECPCPECGAFTEIMWQHIEWPPGEPEGAAFRCPHCAALVEETRKLAMVTQGRWRATAPEVANHAGFRLNSLVSLLHNARWGVLAAEFLRAKDNPETLQPFVNTVLAQGWRAAGEDLDDTALADRVEPFGLDAIPPEVLVITAGCDVQDDRIEISFAGFARDGTCYVLAHAVLYGPTAADQIWIDLDDVLKQRWPHPLGGTIGVDASAVDAGDGGAYDRVLKFCTPRWNRRIFATKGAAGFARPAFKQSAALKGRLSQRLYIIGVDSIKSVLFAKLQRGKMIRFSNALGPEYFEQLASERRVIKYLRGRPEPRFERIPGRRAETLDCLVMCIAAREGCAIALDAREQALRLNPASAPRPNIIRSKWLDGL
jgi:phage terminase large subunit GpA-like protein